MKRKIFLGIMILIMSSTVLYACDNKEKKEQISQIFAVSDEVVKSEKDIVIEDEKVATAEQNQGYKMYENESVQFSYPKAWILTEKIEEDGMQVTLKDGDREVFSLDQGEYILVDMDATEEDYYRKYQETYPYLDIVGIDEITMDECEARKLTFTYRKEDIDYTGVKYMLVNDEMAMIFHSELPTKIISEYEKQIVSICESVILKEADKAELEQMIYFEKQEYACDKELITEKIDTESVYLYGVCELGERTVQVYRNIQDYLVIAAVDKKGEHTVLACETDGAYLTYESLLKGKEVSTWMTMQEDLFGYPTVLIQVLVGASATDYFVIGEVDGSCQVLFHECESGLKIGDVDGDGVKELISSLDGYFYRYEGGRVCKYKAVLPNTIKQMVWEGNYFSLYLSDGTKKKGELVVQESGVWSLAEKEYMTIHVFEQSEVEIVPNLELYTFEQARELGIMTQQQGQLPGFGVWYTVEIDGVVYHYGHYENQTQEQAQLCSYAIVKDTYALANGISVGMTEEEILAKYPNMAVMNFNNEYLYEAVTGHQGWNGIAYPCITQEENGAYMRQCWLDQFDYVMIGDINLKTEDTVPIYLGLLMKDGKVGAITQYNPTAGTLPSSIKSTEEIMQQSVVHISMKDSVGSGVIVDMQNNDMIVVSNKHLLQKDVEAEVTLANGETYQADVLGLSQQYDIGFLKLQIPEDVSGVEKVDSFYAKESLYLGTDILQYSARQAGVIECHKGYISGEIQYMDEFHSDILPTKCYSAAGMSGGGLFHTNGEFLGMIAGGEVSDDATEREAEITYCIPSDLIWEAYTEVTGEEVQQE